MERFRSASFLNSRVISSTVLWLAVVCLLSGSSDGQSQCTNQFGCFPPVGNLAQGRTVNASSTCTSGSTFCLQGQGCAPEFVCNQNSTHSSSNINDGNAGSIWISEIGLNDGDIVTIQLDFEAPVLFESMEVEWASARPRSMVFERSKDNGQTWQPYRYYSSSCNFTFMLPESSGTSFTSMDAICTAAESTSIPYSGGLVTFSTAQHLPAGTSSEEATDYKLVTNVRLVLVNLFSDVFGSMEAERYYAISEWTVNGTCMCNGHASMCSQAPGETFNIDKVVYAGCMCQHATVGTHCDACDTGFNAVPWTPGTDTEANACQECNCNGNAADCEYILSQMSAVCINCTVPTTGDNCDQCLPGFYDDLLVLPSNPAFCKPCDCDEAGTVDPGVCSTGGQCACKANIDSDSLRCDTCEDGFWNISAANTDGCQECECNSAGTLAIGDQLLCNKTNGICLCKDNVIGDRCDRCADGFFDLDNGCLACECNVAGSEGPVCDQDSAEGQCPCKPNIDSIRCTTPVQGFSYNFLDSIRFEAEDAQFTENVEVILPLTSEGGTFTGRGFISLSLLDSIKFTVEVPRDYQYELVLRYQADAFINVPVTVTDLGSSSQDFNCNAGGNLVPRLSALFMSPFDDYIVADTICLSTGSQYEVTIDYTGIDSWLLDSVVLLPDFAALSFFYAEIQFPIDHCLPYSASTNELIQGDPICDHQVTFGLSVEFYGQVYPCDCNETGSVDNICNPLGGVCLCREGVGGDRCEYCENGFFNFSSNGCQACNCSNEGSTSQVCNFETGQCSCKDGVGGTQTCSSCLPGFFDLTTSGCSPCQCSEYAISMECSDTGQCQCPNGIINLKCDQCLEGYYNISRSGCQECDCDPVSSLSTDCDLTTGQCNCTGGATGRDCSQCPGDHFITDGISREYCVECVCSGQTQICTVDNTTYALGAFQSSFTDLCAQIPTNCSDGWELTAADGQMAAPYGPSDASGLGYILLDNNFPQLHAPEHFLGDRRAAYGLNFVVDLSISNDGRLNEDSTFVRITGSFLNETLIAAFPNPTTMENGIAADNFLRYSVPFIQGHWHLGNPGGPPATAIQLISVLADLTELSFTAEFTEDLIEFVQVRSINLFVAVSEEELDTFPGVIIMSAFPVENCLCPEGYSGQSCQECARGYLRVTGNPADPCIPCNCSGLALECEPTTGVCFNCTGNSVGVNCEQCQPGFFGDPTRGIPCLPCECPTTDRTFSPTCFLNTTTNSSVCDDCAHGYTGQNCELCMDGFYGNPFIGLCITCECNGNVDPALGPTCDMITGRCLNCQNNTEGFECERCKAGFFGDPTVNNPCRPCNCHENGTDGFCDRLTGECNCLPNVFGEMCDQCEPGFWGISQGPGCIPCDCCATGSLSSSCDQDTGRCDCLPNVGSEEDAKCCMCSPGFFNFSPDAGCEACNCSVLAVSPECSQDEGQCVCQEGAVGLKCDDCDLGYFGKVPDCERCHECFFQWHDIISSLLSDATALQASIEALITDNYNGYTVSAIESEVEKLLQQLVEANQSLSSITLQSEDIDDLERSLSEINAGLTEVIEVVTEIQQQLNTSAIMVNTANAFDGTVNGTSANNIQQQALLYNTTIASLAVNASNQLKALMQYQTQVNDAWMQANILDAMVELLLVNLSQSANNTQVAASVIEQFQEDFFILRSNLTRLDVNAQSLSSTLQSLFLLAANISGDLVSANSSAQSLLAEAQSRTMQAEVAYQLAKELNDSVEAAWVAAQQSMDSASKLLNQTVSTTTMATNLLEDVTAGVMDVETLTQTLAASKDLAQQILENSLPSLEVVNELARKINDSIVPDELVQDILENATNSRIIAEMALETAEMASDAVKATWELLSELMSDINNTRSTLMDVDSTITQVQLLLNQTQEDLVKIEESSIKVEEILVEIQQIQEEVSVITERADMVGMENRQRASDIYIQVSNDAEVSQELQQLIEDLQANYSSKEQEVNTTYTDAVSDLDTTNQLLSDAQQLNSTVTAVSVQQLIDLLDEYVTETEMLNNLEEEVQRLEQELEDITSSFLEASERLSECYKTP